MSDGMDNLNVRAARLTLPFSNMPPPLRSSPGHIPRGRSNACPAHAALHRSRVQHIDIQLANSFAMRSGHSLSSGKASRAEVAGGAHAWQAARRAAALVPGSRDHSPDLPYMALEGCCSHTEDSRMPAASCMGTQGRPASWAFAASQMAVRRAMEGPRSVDMRAGSTVRLEAWPVGMDCATCRL